MRAVVQRVQSAEVLVDGRVSGRIGKGLLVFVGVGRGDDERDLSYLTSKIPELRIFEDESEKFNLSLKEIGGEMLVVSQFTLYGDCRKGRRPSFTAAESSDRARFLCNYFIGKTNVKIDHVAQGKFQAMMSIELVNNGPVTMLLDSRRIF